MTDHERGRSDQGARGRVSRRRVLTAGAGAALALGGLTVARAWPVGDDGDPLWLQAPDSQHADLAPAAEPDPPPAEARTSNDPPSAQADVPAVSDVARTEPWDALRFLAGRHPRYPGASLDTLMGFSPANILETMDTVVMDAVHANRGGAALVTLYRLIAVETLEALLAVYGDAPVVLALDAGHGGKRGVFYDPGSNGTEAEHTRQVVVAIEERAADARYAGITVRRIFNDAIGDDFSLPPPEDRKGAAALTMRLVRGAMLAQEVAAWNAARPDALVALHMLSVHFNAGSGGILVLHQGGAAPDAFRSLSVAFARSYVASARPALNRSGLLPSQLSLALGTGLSDDALLYEPAFRTGTINPYTGVNRSSFPRRYAMLQSSLLQRDYALGALIYNKLV